MSSWHYVIVGGGTAGAVMAAKLSEDPETTVLLLEAGPAETSAETPRDVRSVDWARAMQVPGRMWPNVKALRTPRQEFRLYERGRGLGGSSAINGMLAIRGRPDDFDRWASDYGCDGWSWADVFPVFLRIEDDLDFGGDGLHGKGGPIPLYRQPREEWLPLDRAVAKVWQDFGWSYTDSYHRLESTGWGPSAWNIRDGNRVNTNDAYLDAARCRENLMVRGDVLVDRVLLDGNRATGVITSKGEEIIAKEVVVSAGSIHSPAILMRSGIGPEVGLPVGKNLMEHSGAAIVLALEESAGPSSPEHIITAGHGHYASGLPEGGPNDMQLLHSTSGELPDGSVMGFMGASVMRVFSRGEVTLASADATTDPIVEFNMLSDRRDLDRLLVGMHRVRMLTQHPDIATLCKYILAGNQDWESLRSDALMEDWLYGNARGGGHAAGTCSMGRRGDPHAVVDPTCRVIGFDNLRVVDASVMPDLTKANTNLSTIAIAERAAELMRSKP